MSCVLGDVIGVLTSLLRQQSRRLKQGSLDTLRQLVLSCKASSNSRGAIDELFQKAELPTLLQHTAALISEEDLGLSYLALELCVSLLDVASSSSAGGEQKMQDNDEAMDVVDEHQTTLGSALSEFILPRALKLASSTMIRDKPLASLLGFFSAMSAKAEDLSLSIDTVLDLLTQPVAKEMADEQRTSVATIAKCIAAVTVSARHAEKRRQTIEKFVHTIAAVKCGGDDSLAAVHLAVLSVGEIGRKIDVSSIEFESPVHEVLLDTLEKFVGQTRTSTSSDAVATAAATALGSLAVGNLQYYLPIVMSSLKTDEQGLQYHMMSALRVIISSSDAAINVDEVMPVLEAHVVNENESVRSIISECLGKLAVIESDAVVPRLAQILANAVDGPSAARLKWTMLRAFKYAMQASSGGACPFTADMAAPYLVLLKDDDLTVRSGALLALNSLLHHHPGLVRKTLKDSVMPTLCEEMKVRDELKRKVNLGPFKHTVDDGLPLRKSAVACVSSIIDNLPDQMASILASDAAFHEALGQGLKDVDDVQMLFHGILCQLALSAPIQLCSVFPTIVPPLKRTLSKIGKIESKTKSATASEAERAFAVIRSCLRAASAIVSIPESIHMKPVRELLQMVRANASLSRIYEGEQSSSLF